MARPLSFSLLLLGAHYQRQPTDHTASQQRHIPRYQWGALPWTGILSLWRYHKTLLQKSRHLGAYLNVPLRYLVVADPPCMHPLSQRRITFRVREVPARYLLRSR
jgi:hypothetical protein